MQAINQGGLDESITECSGDYVTHRVCWATCIYCRKNMRFIRDGNTEAFRPSLSVTVVQECVKERGYHETTRINDKVYHCDGQYKLVGTPYGTQPGYMTGVLGGVVQGGAIVGGAYLLADGIRDSGSETTNNNNTESNGGNSNSLSSARSDSYSQSGASAAASGGSGGNGYGYGGKGAVALV